MSTHEGTLFDGLGEPDASLPSGRFASEKVERVLQWFTRCAERSNLEDRFSSVLRQSIDEVLDGQRTGRYDLKDLSKTEKTYLGTKVEIVCQNEFGFSDGSRMDYKISGVDVDAKFSLTGEWMIPTEAMGQICLVMSADDEKSTFDVGLVHVAEEILRGGANKDSKRQMSASGRSAIRWIFKSGRLRRNILLGLNDEKKRLIFSGSTGQQRVNNLFENLLGQMIDRTTVQTTARQLDAPKRVRDARRHLASKGIVILGHQNESVRVASALGIAVPDKSSWISVRLVPAEGRSGYGRQVEINGSWYVRARDDDPAFPAPAVAH
ncbi:NaeI family type II restriction endonuclease [Streptomyces abikoensis]|uniref:NaeI family type II restriction endonuclease n=1 Tax=Streptomyces abikoensis TaxID=97398 RepID=A0ABW7TA32_9ACTN